MAISMESVVQVKTGTAASTPFNAFFDNGTTAGNTVIVIVVNEGYTVGVTFDAAGFLNPASQPPGISMRYKPNIGGGLTTWASDSEAPLSGPISWVLLEVADLDLSKPFDVSTNPSGTGTTTVTATGPVNTVYEGLAVAVFSGYNNAGTTPVAFSSYSGGYEEIATVANVGGSTALTGTVAMKVVMDISADGADLTAGASSSASADLEAMVYVFASAAGKRRPDLVAMFGAEIGTTAGLVTGPQGYTSFDSQVGTPAIVTTTPRTGGYCLELSASAAAESVSWAYASGAGVLARWYPYPHDVSVLRLSVYFPTSLPAGDTELFSIGVTTGCKVFYRSASQKIGMQLLGTNPAASGTEQLSATTVSAGTWYDLDVFLDLRTTGWVARWQLDGVEQTDATLGQNAAGSADTIRFGWGSATTATVRLDDIALSYTAANYPLGPIKIYPLKVDPAGTLTASNTALFNTFTNNGTLSAWNATTARGAIDDIPPTIGASADGIAQITNGSGDYVEIPMETRNAATNLECIRGVRWYICGWAASTTAATIMFQTDDPASGFVDLTIGPGLTDPQFDNSTTTPAWVVAPNRQEATDNPFPWTQTRLDDLWLRMGFSNDAAPDIGVHAVLAELAIRAAVETRLVDNDGASVDGFLDPDGGAVVALRLNAPGDRGASADYIIRGVPVTRTAAAGATDLYTVAGEVINDVTFVSCTPTA